MGSSYREIISLQCGHFSNFIGTHWWNIQESAFCYEPLNTSDVPKEINSNILFREGLTLAGEVTYTPRLVAIDLKGSLNTLKAEGVLYDTPVQDEDLKWTSDVTLHKTDSVPKNEFLTDLEKVDKIRSGGMDVDDTSQGSQEEADIMDTDDPVPSERQETPDVTKKIYNLDNQVNVWSDYLRIHLHPKTCSVVQEYTHDSVTEQFDVFMYGQQVMNNTKTADDIEDRIRFFTEECDSLQGFQLLLDTYDGFSGIGCKLMEQLVDDFSSKTMLSLAVSPSHFPDTTSIEDSQRVINSVLSYDRLCNHSSLFVPLSLASTLWRKPGSSVNFPNLIYDASLKYHNSAILAMALETATLPYRLENNSVQMNTITDTLAAMGRKAASLSVALPVPLSANSTFADMLSNFIDVFPWQSVTPYCSQASPVNCYAQTVALRGIPKGLFKRSSTESDIPSDNQLQTCRNMDEMLRMYLTAVFPRTLNSGIFVEQPCKTTTPFPHIFSPKIDKQGLERDVNRPSTTAVESVPVMTTLQSTSCMDNLLSSLHTEGKKLDINKFHHYLNSGLEVDDYSESLENLQELAQCYQNQIS
ncbi:protein misato homolog 1-like [Ptychodera flava]|uniref:protein misato homolog 1-like n=1 Tax=Ptychodera flava TaxID=63121 RepID=UPI00396A2CC6